MSVTHPLNHTWCFWDMLQGVADYSKALRKTGEVDSVESFWEFYLTMQKPSELFGDAGKKVQVDGHEIKAFGLFKKGIEPKWEDEVNAAGGQYDSSSKHLSSEAIDSHWETLVLGLMGNTFDENDNICGIRIVKQPKKKILFKLEIWLRRREEGEVIIQRIAEALATQNEKVKPTYRFSVEDFHYTPHSA